MTTKIETSSPATKAAIRNVAFGSNILTVGDSGKFATVELAVAFINAQPRYTVIYDTGTATLTNGERKATPSGGAVWSALTNAVNSTELWMYLDVANVWLPLIGGSPHEETTNWSDYVSLLFPYIGTTGAKSYQLVTPIWYHIELLSGEYSDTTDISWPLFTTMSGVSKEASVYRGSISLGAGDPGIWLNNLTWSSIHGIASVIEEALITTVDKAITEEGYAQVVIENISGGRGNAERDVIYRTADGKSFALFKSMNCDYYGNYDAVQCSSRYVIFKHNNIYLHYVDEAPIVTFVLAGFRWFSGTKCTVDVLNIDMCNNNFYITAEDQPTPSKTYGLFFFGDDVYYLTTSRPSLFGQILDNYFEITTDSANNADIVSIYDTPSLWGANNSQLFIDRNIFNSTIKGGGGGTIIDVHTSSTVSNLILGQGNQQQSGSPLAITGSPVRKENHGLSGAIASGATIPHGLGAVPTSISITPTGAKTDVYATVNATNITVNFGGGGTSTFHWKVEL